MHQSLTFGKPLRGHPVVFGEILFDHFPDGREVPGGAPLNVAWHLCGFGHDPLLVSRIGRDQKGDEIRRRMADWGLGTAGLEVDDAHPTGRVTAEIEDGEPRFRIEPDQAYDRIDATAARDSGRLEGAAILYHGSLALRAPISRAAFAAVRTACCAPTFVDINLRSPWWNLADARALLQDADLAKLNADELATLADADCGDEEGCVIAAARLADTHGIAHVVVTRGGDGALIFGAGGVLARGEAVPVEHLVDTVGAGDAFAAVTLVGLLEGWTPVVTLVRALRFAADICVCRGATPSTRDPYAAHRSAWQAGREPHA